MSKEEGQVLTPLMFLKGHLFAKLPTPSVDLTGRTVLVTGGNTGLGYGTVLHFARCNATRIIIASRNIEKSQTAAQNVHTQFPGYKGQIDILHLDLSSFASVILFCKIMDHDEGRLDIVIANSGIMRWKYGLTGDGYEEVLQVNGLSTALMGLLLLPKLEQTSEREVPFESKRLKAIMVFVAGDVYYWANFPVANTTGPLIEALNDHSKDFDISERYSV